MVTHFMKTSRASLPAATFSHCPPDEIPRAAPAPRGLILDAGSPQAGQCLLLKPPRQSLADVPGEAAGLPYTKTSRSGPVPESNFAAIFSLMLKRSHSTPAVFRIVA